MTVAAVTPESELVAWAAAHGPDHLRFAAERARVTIADVMDAMVQALADHLGGRVMYPNDELIDWQPRRDPNAANIERSTRVTARIFAWWVATEVPDCITYERSEIVRVEEQKVVTDPASVLKYSAVVLTVSVLGRKWFVLVNLEAGVKR